MITYMVKNKAHNLIEYTLIIGIVTVALFAMSTYFKRGIQGVIKVVADDMGPQGEPFASEKQKSQEEQVSAALKTHYGFEHQYVYGQSAQHLVSTMNWGQGDSKKWPQGQTTYTEQSYGSAGELALDRDREMVNPASLPANSGGTNVPINNPSQLPTAQELE